MDNILIIGYGNLLRGDDGIGWYAARLLAARLPDARVITVHQLMPELAEEISHASLVVFLDACAGGVPGTIRSETPIPAAGAALLTHHANPAALLALARDLFGRCPPAVMLSVAGLSFDLRDSLSPLVQHMLPSLVDQAHRIIEEYMGINGWEWEREPSMHTH